MDHRSTRQARYAVTLWLCAACGSSAEAPREALTDGGLHSPDAGFDAEVSAPVTLRVRVIDATAGTTISSARVRAGTVEQRSNLRGNAAFRGLAPGGRVEVEAAGYVPAVWQGVPGEELVVSLAPRKADHARATLRGTIAGLASLPTLAPSHRYEIEIRHSLPLDLPGVGTNLAIPNSQTARCILQASQAPSCAFELTTQAGAQRVYAVAFDVDTHGTPEAADDTRSALALAFSARLEASIDEVRDDVALTLATAERVASVNMTADKPNQVAEVVGVPGVKMLDGSGVMLFPVLGGASLLPLREDVVGDATYWAIAEATYTEPDGDQLRLRAIRRDVAPDDLQIAAWPEPPGRTTRKGNALKLSLAQDAALHTVRLRDATNEPLLDAVLIDEDTLEMPEQVSLDEVATAEITAITAPLPVAGPLDMGNVRRELSAELVRTIRF